MRAFLPINLILICFVNVVLAQKSTYFKYSKINYSTASIDSFFKTRKINYPVDLKTVDKKIKVELENVIKESDDYIRSFYTAGMVIDDSLINAYYKTILKNILEANPHINKEIKLVVIRAKIPNAFAMGNGVICVFTGLIPKLKSESQMAFILCHELAHKERNHSLKTVLKQIQEGRMDNEVVKQLKKNVQKGKIGARTEYESRYYSFVLDSRKYSREKELEADSIGLTYLKNTNYNIKNGVESMDGLKTADKDYFDNAPLNFRNYFDSLGITYKKSWEFYGQASSLQAIKVKYETPDSLLTHPNTEIRKSKLISHLKDNINNQKNKVNIQGDSNFIKQVYLNFSESCISQYYADNLGSTIYYAMQMAEMYPNDMFPYLLIGASLAELSIHSKKRELRYFLQVPSYNGDTPFDRTLAFLNELRYSEMAALSYNMIRKHVRNLSDDQLYLYAMYISSYANNKLDEAETYATQYNLMYSEGYFIDLVKNLKQ